MRRTQNIIKPLRANSRGQLLIAFYARYARYNATQYLKTRR